MDSATEAASPGAPPEKKGFPGGAALPFSLLTAAGVAGGLYLRWRMATLGRSLWLDPAMLAWNVVQRGYGGLFLPLDENQAALWLAWRYAASDLAGDATAPRGLRRFVAGAALAAWLSHTSLLVAAALLAVLWLETRQRGDPAARRRFASGCALLLAHHTLLYLLQMRKAAAADLFAYHSPDFAPWPPWRDWAWYLKSGLGYFEFPFGSPGAVALPLLGAALGLLALRGRRLEAGLLLGPLLALLAAAALKLYPLPTGGHDIHSRLLLFTLPCVCLLIGRGFGSLAGGGRLGVTLALLAALVHPAAARSFGEAGYLRQEMAPLVEELRSRREQGDQVYVFHAAMPAFRYYTRESPIPYLAGQPGASAEADLRRDAEKLRAGRVWVVFSHFYSGEDQIFRALLEERGERLLKHIHAGAVLELYALRENAEAPAPPAADGPQSG